MTRRRAAPNPGDATDARLTRSRAKLRTNGSENRNRTFGGIQDVFLINITYVSGKRFVCDGVRSRTRAREREREPCVISAPESSLLGMYIWNSVSLDMSISRHRSLSQAGLRDCSQGCRSVAHTPKPHHPVRVSDSPCWAAGSEMSEGWHSSRRREDLRKSYSIRCS